MTDGQSAVSGGPTEVDRLRSGLLAIPGRVIAIGRKASLAFLDKPDGGCQSGPMSRLLNDEEITKELGNLPAWRRDGKTLVASYDSPDFPAAVQLIEAAGDEAEKMSHHPDIDLRWKVTTWRLSTHSEGGLTQLDIVLAHRISAAATRLEAVSKEPQ
jgi:4a-hydroxytetrahydrobiopterin dehydratase